MRQTVLLAASLALLTPALPTSLAGQTGGVDTAAYSGLRWRNTGPARGGRSVAAAGSVARPSEYWMGTTGGGVFKSTDGGENWSPVSDKYFGGTIGAIAVAPTNPDVVYVGGGEFPIRGNTSHGDGVYKTTDAGRTWRYLGLVETRHISKIRIHPNNPDVLWVAALGKVWGPSPERGIFKSTDGGEKWRKVLFRNDSTGAIDLSMDPNDPNVLYAALWQAGRTPWMLNSGGAGSGIFKSTDGGETWREITRNPGLPKGVIGNLGISASPVQRGRVWAQIEAEDGGVFLSDDGGASWQKVNSERKLRQRAWYYTRIYADTRDANTVYASNVQFQRSTDGGRTWTNIRAPHGDSHDLWIAPDNNQRMIESNDGGANVSLNAGASWTAQDFLTAQFYHVTTTRHFPYHICGAQQDNSTICGASRPSSGSNIEAWYDAGGGESGYIAVRPDNPDIIYAGSYGGYLTRKDVRTGIERAINPWPMNPMGHSAKDLKYRFQWTYPIVISPHDPNTLYVAGNVLFKSTDDGQSFTPVSPDLTRNDPQTLGPSGGPITKDQTSVEYYGTIFTVSESPLEKGVIWTGSDDGLVQLTRDGGTTWTNVTPPDMERYTRVSIIEASAHRKGALYLAANRFQLNDNRPYLWKTADYGATWTRIDRGIRSSDFTRVIREDPERQGLLYAGTERGVWVSFNDGTNWQSLQNNLPPVPVHDLSIAGDDLVAGTHGRSFWVLENLAVLRQLSSEVIAKNAHLFQPAPAYRSLGGVQVAYWLKQSGQTVKVEFLDGSGNLIKSYSSTAPASPPAAVPADDSRKARADSLRNLGVMEAASLAGMVTGGRGGQPGGPGGPGGRFGGTPQESRAPSSQGMNRFNWNLRHADATRFNGMIMWAAGITGPVAAPGEYTIRLTVGEAVQTQTFRVLVDPRSGASDADVVEQVAFLLKVRDKTTEANDWVRTVRSVRSQLQARIREAGSRAGQLERMARPFLAELGSAEAEIYQVKNESGQDPLNFPIRLNNKIAALAGVVGSAEGRPTKQSYEVYGILSDSLAIQTRKLQGAIDGTLPRINAELSRLGLPAIVAKPEDAGAAGEEEPELAERQKW